jgi:hypothetical protein
MHVTVEMVSTLGGTNFPLDQRIADALAHYAAQAADAAGMPRQTWVRRVWNMADYEAKDILRGNASKAHYERILKLKGEHRGWFVGLVVTGAVIGQPIHEFFREQTRLAAKEAEQAKHHEQLATAAWGRLAAAHRDSRAVPAEDRTSTGTLRAQKARRVGREG